MPRPSDSAATVVTNGVRDSVRSASVRLRMGGWGRGSERNEAVGTVLQQLPIQ